MRLIHFLALALFVQVASAAEPVIAYVGPLSSPAGPRGHMEKLGFELAVSEFKAKGMRVGTVVMDDGCQPALSLEKLRIAIQRDHASAVIGAACLQGEGALPLARETSAALVLTTSPGTLNLSQTPSNLFFVGPSRQAANGMASALSRTAKLSIEAGARCFFDYRVEWPADRKIDAQICPVLSADEPAWKSFRSAFYSAHRQEPDAHALLAYTATQIALTGIQKSDGDPRRVAKEIHQGSFSTAFGSVKLAQPNALGSLLTVVPHPEAKTDAVSTLVGHVSKKTCDKCKKSSECPQSSTSDLILATKEDNCCKKSSECPQGSLLRLR